MTAGFQESQPYFVIIVLMSKSIKITSLGNTNKMIIRAVVEQGGYVLPKDFVESMGKIIPKLK
jgi:hypothetical protein